jgi:hypothetical protein
MRYPWPSLLIGFGLALGLGSPSLGAEQVVLRYSILQESIPVQDFSQLSRRGEVSPRLGGYLALANKQPEDLRRWLNQSVQASPELLSQVLNGFLGQYLLGQISEVFHTPSQKASPEALRGALITSAQNDNQVQVIEILENYPTQELHVNGDRLMELYQQFKSMESSLSKLPF